MQTASIVCQAIVIALIGLGQTQPLAEALTPPAEVLAALRRANPTYLSFPAGAARRQEVPADRVPSEVRAKAADWAVRIVRPTWLPEDIEQRLRGERWRVARLAHGRYDVLTAEYPLAGGSCSLTEKGAGLSLLWHNPNITPGDDPNKTALLLAQVLLNVPDEEAPNMQPELKEVPDAGVRLFCGRIKVPIEPLPREEWEDTPGRNPYWHKQWYHDMFVWLADGYFYVSVLERTGRPVTNLQAKPGVPPRFLPADAPGEPAEPAGEGETNAQPEPTEEDDAGD